MRTALTVLSFFFVLAIMNTGEHTALAAAAKGDADKSAPTASDQQENEADRKISQQIRQAVTKDDSLSVSAQNVKIITQDGKVTLRGSVKNDSEKQKIAAKAKQAAGVKSVENLITVGEKGEK
jgi:osmotically-inducible protein OsmY